MDLKKLKPDQIINRWPSSAAPEIETLEGAIKRIVIGDIVIAASDYGSALVISAEARPKKFRVTGRCTVNGPLVTDVTFDTLEDAECLLAELNNAGGFYSVDIEEQEG